MGLWDTVSSVGWISNPEYLPYTASANTSVEIVRHAVALDERRAFFRTNLWEYHDPKAKPAHISINCEVTNDKAVEDVWFPGVHSDVGGGYGDSELWKPSFAWMVREATSAGVIFNPDQVKTILGQTTEQEWCRSKIHESLEGKWWLGEFLPKKYRWHKIGKRRTVYPGALLHQSIIDRMRADSTYRPKNLEKSFIDRAVQGSSPTTEVVPYLPMADD